MEGFDPATSFGDEVSKRYDEVDTRGDEEETVAFLARLAGDQDALEFAVGTGVRVDGIEMSTHMVERMREKPGGTSVEVTMGDMSRVTTGRTYGLVYLVFNTIGNLPTQDDQVRCFENAAHRLNRDGVFVLECRVPTAPSRPGQLGRVLAVAVEQDRHSVVGHHEVADALGGHLPVSLTRWTDLERRGHRRRRPPVAPARLGARVHRVPPCLRCCNARETRKRAP